MASAQTVDFAWKMILHLKVKPDKKRASKTSFLKHLPFLVDGLQISFKTFLWHCWPFFIDHNLLFLIPDLFSLINTFFNWKILPCLELYKKCCSEWNHCDSCDLTVALMLDFPYKLFSSCPLSKSAQVTYTPLLVTITLLSKAQKQDSYC